MHKTIGESRDLLKGIEESIAAHKAIGESRDLLKGIEDATAAHRAISEARELFKGIEDATALAIRPPYATDLDMSGATGPTGPMHIPPPGGAAGPFGATRPVGPVPVPAKTTPTPDADPVVVVCTGCGNPLPTTEHTPKLLASPPCPACFDSAPADFRVLGELHLGHEDDAPESGVYLIVDEE